jgi:hypothetical protein
MHLLQLFYLDVTYVCNDFQVFLGVFASVPYTCFKCFIYILLYVAIVASECLKSRLSVAYGMRVGSDWRRGPAAGVLACKPDALGRSSLTERVPFNVEAVPARGVFGCAD